MNLPLWANFYPDSYVIQSFWIITESLGLNEIQVRKEFAPDISASLFFFFPSVLIDLIQMDYNITQSAVTV